LGAHRGLYIILALAVLVSLVGAVSAETGTAENGTGLDHNLEERFREAVDGWLGSFGHNIEWLSVAAVDFLRKTIKVTYFAVGLIGFVMWSSGISRYSGKRLMLGAIAMAFVAEVAL